MGISNSEHVSNIGSIVLFVYRYRRYMQKTLFLGVEPSVNVRDGTIHEMIFDFLVNTQPFTGSDWDLVLRDKIIADEVVRHILIEEYPNKDEILSQWREHSTVP